MSISRLTNPSVHTPAGMQSVGVRAVIGEGRRESRWNGSPAVPEAWPDHAFASVSTTFVRTVPARSWRAVSATVAPASPRTIHSSFIRSSVTL